MATSGRYSPGQTITKLLEAEACLSRGRTTGHGYWLRSWHPLPNFSQLD